MNDYPFESLANVILVKNLPDEVTSDEVFQCFSKYGHVMAVNILTLQYNNFLYNFNMAYVKFDSTNPIREILGNDLDVILKGYYLEIETVYDNKFIWNTMFLLGIGNELQRTDIEAILPTINSPKLIFLKEATKIDNGFGMVEFSCKQHVRACLELSSTIDIESCIVGIYPFPLPVFHFLECKANPLPFLALKNNHKFEDFTFIVAGTEYKCSGILASLSCEEVKKIVEKGGHSITLDTEGDFSVIMDHIYGQSVRITGENCLFVYYTSCLIGCHELRRLSSLVCYDMLTPEMAVSVYNNYSTNGIEPEYVIEFIATHLREVSDFSQLPPRAYELIASHHAIVDVPWEDVNLFFRPAVASGKIQLSSIVHPENTALDIDKARPLLDAGLEGAIAAYALAQKITEAIDPRASPRTSGLQPEDRQVTFDDLSELPMVPHEVVRPDIDSLMRRLSNVDISDDDFDDFEIDISSDTYDIE